LGLLISFVNEVNRGLSHKEMNPMGTLYVFDDKAEIQTPGTVPENWPLGFIRVYTQQAKSTKDVEFTLRNFDPAHNSAGYDARRGGSLDQAGLRFVSQHGYAGLEAHYMVVPEFEQLSFVPFIGNHTQSAAEILLESKLGGYDRKTVLAAFEESSIKEAYNEEDMEHFQVPHTYTNWVLLNALVIAKIITLRALALSEHGDNVYRETSRYNTMGQVVPIDVSVKDPAEALEHKVGDHDGDLPLKDQPLNPL
jgi:hypothetical protein